VISDERVAEYEADEAFEAAQPESSIALIDDPEDYWVVQDEEGSVFFEHDARGWPDQEDAEHEARYLQSRTGLVHFARPQRLKDALETHA
jgi:hypothetical protein